VVLTNPCERYQNGSFLQVGMKINNLKPPCSDGLINMLRRIGSFPSSRGKTELSFATTTYRAWFVETIGEN